ncbi:MAG: alpha/beta fold hydrolase [Betaproteobacteria bacterium]|nr:alpha/beta fold hydrolase [Betaproteobacteria bacterium]MSQ89603.1 alpha/beta fold hydrolase [Betaproteobacteria bacterium]
MAKPLVFVHGFACTHADWRLQQAQFSTQHPTYTLDLRGHGATHARPEDCSIETYGSDIAALLEGKDLKGAVLIGHSMGCRVVLQAYLNAPERIAALVLIDGSFQGNSHPVSIENYANFAGQLFAGMFLSPSELGAAITERALRLPEVVGASLFPRMARWDAENMERALTAVKAPLLVIQSTYLNAERKRVALKAGETTPWLDLVRRLAPQARIEIIPGTGHFPQLETPQAVNKYLAELIDA